MRGWLITKLADLGIKCYFGFSPSINTLRGLVNLTRKIKEKTACEYEFDARNPFAAGI